MSEWNLGSVAATVLDLIDDIPTNVSGTRMLEMADRQRTFVEQYTGQSVGSVGIDIKFQNVLVYLTAADVAKTMTILGTDATKMQLGDFEVEKGQGSNTDEMSKRFKNEANEELKILGRKRRFGKAFG